MVEKSLGTFSNPLSYVAGAVCYFVQCRPHLFVSVNISFSYISCVLVLSLIMKVKFKISLLIRVQNPESKNPDFSGLNPNPDPDPDFAIPIHGCLSFYLKNSKNIRDIRI